MPLCLFIFFFYRTYIHTVQSSVAMHSAEVPLHLLIAGHCGQLPGVPSRQSNSALPYSKPTHYQLSYAATYTAAWLAGRLDARIRKCQAEIRNSVTQNEMAKTWGESASQTKYCGIHTYSPRYQTNPEPVFLNVYGAQESIPRNEFHQPM